MKKQTLQTILIFFVFGIISAFSSLIVMTLLPLRFANNETVANISLLAFLEEIVKLFFLYFIFLTHSLDKFLKVLRLFIFPVFLGLGFSFFELSMIFFQQAYFPLEAFFPTIVHVVSAILLANAINAFYSNNLKALAFPLTLLAVFIHVCYNVTIVKII